MHIAAMKKRAPSARLGMNMPAPPLALVPPTGIVTQQLDNFDRFINHPGFGLSPQRVIQIYRMAECGWPLHQVDMFEDVIEADGHLRSVIEARTLAVAGKPWRVVPGGDDQLSLVAAEMLQQSLEETNFDEAIGMIVGARPYGYSGSEIKWERLDGDTVPTHFIPVPFRRFRFDENDQPFLINSANGFEGEPLTPGKWIFTISRGPLTSVTARAGLMRTATWYSLFKRWSWRDWVIYAEKFGIPLVLGKYDDDATEDQKAEIQNTVEDIGEAGQAIMSKEAEVEIREAQRGGDSNGLHKSIVAESNSEISKLITGSTLTVESGGPGSFALGKVHESRAFDLVVSDANLVAKKFRDDIAKPFLKWNGFEGARVPKLVIEVTREIDLLTRVKIAQILHQMGLPLDTEQLHGDFQMRKPPSDERTLAATAPVSEPPTGEPSDSEE